MLQSINHAIPKDTIQKVRDVLEPVSDHGAHRYARLKID